MSIFPKMSIGDVDQYMKRNALIGVILLGSLGLLLVLMSLMTGTIRTSQEKVFIAISALLTVAGFGAIPLLHRGWNTFATGVVYGVNLLFALTAAATQDNFGWPSFVYAIVSSSLLILISMPVSSRKWSMRAALVILIAILVIEWLDPPFRIVPRPGSYSGVVVFTIIFTIAFGFLASSRTWGAGGQVDPYKARLTALVMGVSGILYNVFGFYLLTRGMNNWQFFVTFGFTVLYTISGLFSLAVTRISLERGFLLRGISILFIVNLLPSLSASIVFQDIGYLAAAYILVSSVILIFEVFPSHSRPWLIITTIAAMVLAVYSGWSDFSFQMVLTEMQTFFPVAIGFVMISFAAIAIRQAAVGNIRTRLILIFFVIGLIPAIIVALIGSLMSTSQVFGMFTASLDEMARQNIRDNARSTASQIEIYLDHNPQLDVSDLIALERNQTLADISVQPVGETGYTAVFDSQGITHFHVNPAIVGTDMSTLADPFPDFWAIFEASLDGANSEGYYDWEDADGVIRPKFMAIRPVGNTPLRVAATTYLDEFEQYAVAISSEMDRVETQILRTIIISSVIVMLLVVGASVYMANRFTAPILEMENASARVMAGDWDAIQSSEAQDEFGALSRTLYAMTQRQRELLETLEQRVINRTRALEISTEVARRLSTILDQELLFKEVVEQLQIAFDYYHVHIYLFDEVEEMFVMVEGTGDAGRQMVARGHRIPRGEGIVGRAGNHNQVILVSNVHQENGWIPNPQLPETKSEVAVPITIGEDVLGVLDVQQNAYDGLGDADANLLLSIASQVAIALQNARAYRQAQEQARHEALIAEIGQRIQSTQAIDEALQVAVRELGRALGAETRISLGP